MQNYKMKIAYDGGRYKGWQRLGGEESTVQEKIEAVLTKMCGTAVEISGASRTDAGVHALDQVASFKIPDNHEAWKESVSTGRDVTEEILDYLNRYLPDDIVVKSVERASARFHARLNATSKVYQYRIFTGRIPDPFTRKYMVHAEGIRISRMKEAAKALVGQHDFTAYTNVKSKKNSHVRNLMRLEFKQEGDMLTLEFEGDGFLHNMIRRIVGTLIDIGYNKYEPAYAAKVLEKKDRSLVGHTAAPQALFLTKVRYGEDSKKREDAAE